MESIDVSNQGSLFETVVHRSEKNFDSVVHSGTRRGGTSEFAVQSRFTFYQNEKIDSAHS